MLNESIYKPNSLHMFVLAKAEKCCACGGKGKIEPKEMVLCHTTDMHLKCKGQTKIDCKHVTPDQLLPCMMCLEVGKTHIGHIYMLASFDCYTLRWPNGVLMEPPKMLDWVKKIKESDLVDGLSQDELRRQCVCEQCQVMKGAGKGE